MSCWWGVALTDTPPGAEPLYDPLVHSFVNARRRARHAGGQADVRARGAAAAGGGDLRGDRGADGRSGDRGGGAGWSASGGPRFARHAADPALRPTYQG